MINGKTPGYAPAFTCAHELCKHAMLIYYLNLVTILESTRSNLTLLHVNNNGAQAA